MVKLRVIGMREYGPERAKQIVWYLTLIYAVVHWNAGKKVEFASKKLIKPVESLFSTRNMEKCLHCPYFFTIIESDDSFTVTGWGAQESTATVATPSLCTRDQSGQLNRWSRLTRYCNFEQKFNAQNSILAARGLEVGAGGGRNMLQPCYAADDASVMVECLPGALREPLWAPH